jgi:hypothetical protein
MTEPRSRASDKSPGAMTANMRSVCATQARTLRIGTHTPGEPIREYVAPAGRDVLVGATEACHVTLDEPTLRGTELLLRCVDPIRGHYVIRLDPGMEAVISRGNETEGVQPTHEPIEVLLAGDARGRVRAGHSWLLFQLVQAPNLGARPPLPVSMVNRGWREVDWRFTIIAAFSFLAHFGGVGMLYSEWLDPIVDDPGIVAALADSIKYLPTVPDVERAERAPTVDGEEVGRKGPESMPRRQGSRGQQGGPTGGPRNAEAALEDAIRELDSMNIQVLSAIDPSSGTATKGVLTDSALPVRSLDELAKRNARIRDDDGLFSVTRVSGPVGLGDTHSGLESIGHIHKREKATVGKETRVDGPRPVGVVEAPPRVTGEVPNAEAVVASLRSGFRRCYELGLNDLPTMRGSVQVMARVGPNGEVLSVSASPAGSISSAVAGCVASRVRGAQFGPPRGGTAVISIPVKLTPQKAR